MLPRAARRLEASLLLSRQALPRPHRLYSTPTKRANAPALAAVQVPRPEYPQFLIQQNTRPLQPSHEEERILNDLERYLARDRNYTVLPPPPPLDDHGEWFTDTALQESLSIMDACLHNLHDVPRAKLIFTKLRQKSASSLLETKIYNAFIEAYFGMAATKDNENCEMWLEDLHDLYHVLESELERTAPNKMTYGLMLRVWQHFGTDSSSKLNLPTPTILLEKMVKRKISPVLVVAETVFGESEDAVNAITVLSQAAVNLNIPEVIAELGQAEAVTAEDVLKDVPEVMPVMKPAKYDDEGNILTEAEVPFNIAQLRRHLTEINHTRRVLQQDAMARQKHLEKSAYDVTLERLQQQSEMLDSLGVLNPALQSQTLQKWMWDWHVKLKERIEKEIEALQESENKLTRAGNYAKRAEVLSPYLTVVKSERLSLITILEIMRLQGSGGLTDGMKTTRALVTVGKAVEMEYKAQMCKKNGIQIPRDQLPRDGDFFSQMGYRSLQQRRIAIAKNMLDGEEWGASWTQVTRSKVGGILVDCLMEVAEVTRTGIDKKTGESVTEAQPAFYHAYEYFRGNKLGVIRLNPALTERLANDQLRDTLHPRHLPMLVKPQPWIDHNTGGYLYSKTPVMRYKDSLEQKIYLKEASKNGQFELVYAGLDVLASTPWKVNRKVFDVVIQVWNAGYRLGKLPPATYDKPEPEPPENFETDMRARAVYLARQKTFNQAKANNHSERCSVNYRLEIARALLNDTFYFPHNMDFRGRAYPIPAHLNHIGDDLCRGLLTFADAKPLGERGLRWLKIHVANLYGYDKANFDDRVKWVDEHWEDIRDTATSPLEGKRWWLTAGDPWQFLAASIELYAAVESGDPHSYESSLPVHQDGTCNGLQHYAALGGDAQGAKQVNLAASDKPSDVYSHVGAMVEKIIAQDVLKGNKIAQLLQGKITRKVVKQTVMTTVYGVTYVGARDQIEKQLKDRGDIAEEECWDAASYLAHAVLNCIGDLFKGAKSIQTWLNLCARLISKSLPEERIPEVMNEYFPRSVIGKEAAEKKRRVAGKQKAKKKTPMQKLKKEQMTSVIWTTPLGLPIVQPYRKTIRKQIMTAVQTVYISDPNTLAEVNAVKQASAFPPNFIHSLDATHMILTALECRKQGLTFASVHDSYWTHASDIDQMSSIIRDTFIALHSSDILGELYREFLKRYKNFKIPLLSLTGNSLVNKLYHAGSRIYATPEQVQSLGALKELIVVSDTASTVDESRAVKDADVMKRLLDDLKEVKAVLADEEADEEGNALSVKEADEATQARVAKEKKEEQQRDVMVNLMGKFVNLTDLFPPLPKKGEFDVGTIKQSQYFFS